MRILFLDQSGKLGGAELSLLDLADHFRDRCRVVTFQKGQFSETLELRNIQTTVLEEVSGISVTKYVGWLHGLLGFWRLFPIILKVMKLSRDYDLVYTNTQKAFVVGAVVSLLCQKPLIYHLRDILSEEHFSKVNIWVAVALANYCATRVIVNSKATKSAFIQAGGAQNLVEVIYNGFSLKGYPICTVETQALRHQLNLEHKFVIGHFSRLSPWKGQHVLIEALADCETESAIVLLVGDALFGEDEYVQQLHEKVELLGLSDRVYFLGFRPDIPQLMAACDLVVHSSVAPEPFGRVIVEAMLAGTPVVAAAAGGAMELIEVGETGWLSPPGDSEALTSLINRLIQEPEASAKVAQRAFKQARERFGIAQAMEQVERLLESVISEHSTIPARRRLLW